MTKSIWVVLVGLMFVSCGKDEPVEPSDAGDTSDLADLGPVHDAQVDVGGDSGADMDAGPLLGRRVPVPVQAGVSPDGSTDIDSAVADEARAGRIAGPDTGFHGLWSHCKPGDFKLYNGRLEACISNEISSRYETFAGGGLVDIRPAGSALPDVFDLYLAKIGFNAVHPDTVEVVRDGSDGGPAVIRATGTDMPAAYFVGVAGDSLFKRNNLTTVLEYRLGPDDDFVEVLAFVTNDTDKPVMAQKGDLIAWGDRMDTYRQKVGFGPGGGAFNWMAAVAPGYSFAYITPDDEVTSLSASFGDPPWEITAADSFVLQPGESFAHFGRLIVGTGGLDDTVRRAKELLEFEMPAQRTVTLVNEAGDPVEGRRVEAFDADDQSLAGGTTDADGNVLLSLPDGSVRFEVSGIAGGGGLDESANVAATIELTVPTVGYIEFDVTADGAPSPASLLLRNSETIARGAVWDARNRVEVTAGDWDVELGRGPEYDSSFTTVTVVAGETTNVSAALTRQMDTADWIAGDFHQHMEPSSDSTIWVEDRVLDNAGQGVEMLVPTDHDVVTDLTAVIASAGLDGIMSTMSGAELSPALAHTNIYPVPFVKEAPGRGTVPLSVLDADGPRRNPTPVLIAAARQLSTDPVVQLNHPRDSSGLFDLVDFDPELGPDAVEHSWFTTDFDAMEVSNGDQCQQFKDISGLWNAGVAPTPIGSSDSHDLWAQAGDQRTYLYAPGVAVNAITPLQVRDIVKAGQVVVGTSVMLDFGAIAPGDTLDGSSGTVEIPLRVQSADWVGVSEIHVVVNGVRTEVIDVTPIDATTDFDATVSVPVTQDAWVVFLAAGEATGTYVPSGKQPYAFNSPLRVDFDGGGYVSPGVGALDLNDIPLCR